MVNKRCSWLGAFIFLMSVGDIPATSVQAAETGWMQKGVRVWYMGAGISADQEEAYLINGFEGDRMSVTRHSASAGWTSPLPAETNAYPRYDKGPFWIHPQVLPNLQVGQTWLGQEITLIERKNWRIYTSNPNDPDNFPHHLLPAWALFKLNPLRLLVKIVCLIPNFSQSVAYFDGETGLLLYRDVVSLATSYFFILSEINYDFQTRRAFPEDDGPQTGFMYTQSEQSVTGGGSVVMHSLVESRYGNTIEMRVDSSLIGPGGMLPLTFENFCFFGDVPLLTHNDSTTAGGIPPENWVPYGQYLWWWLPPEALAGNNINVLGVPMTRTTTGADGGPQAPPLKAPDAAMFTATESPQTFHYSALWFAGDGYLTLFSAKDSRIGLDILGGQIFANNNTLTGISYYRDHMGNAVPLVLTPAVFLPLIKK
jgi:hypothetical protein